MAAHHRFMRASCVLATFVSTGGLGAGCSRRAPAPRAPVVIVSIDTLRADHLPAYGYRGVQTPNLDGLRKDSILFSNAYSHVPLTLPSHASLFTGLLPFDHGVRDNLGYRLDATKHKTLGTLLREKGYATGAFVSAHVLSGATGLGEGFDTFDDQIAAPAGADALARVQRHGDETLARAKAWLGTVGGRPFFLFFHVYEPHAPYEPPPPYKDRYPLAYDGEIAKSDQIVGGLVGELRRLGLYDKAVVAVLSDHGEGLGEHGEDEHGILLYRWSLHVPLLLKLPGANRAGTTVERPVALVDVLPTFATLIGFKPPDGLPGQSLLDVSGRDAAIYAETYYPRIHLGWSPLRSLIGERYQYIEGRNRELYDVLADPKEQTDRMATDSSTARPMQAALARYPEKPPTQPTGVTAADMEKLAALGYLGGTADVGAGPLPDPRERIHVLADVKAGFKLAAAGRDEEALAIFQGVLEANPMFFDARFEMAQTLKRLGRFPEAYGAFKSALRASPSLAVPLSLELGRVCLKLGKLEEAEANARIGLSSNAPVGHELLARIALASDDLATAESEARAVHGDRTAELGAAVVRAEVAIRRGTPAEALSVLSDAKRGRSDSDMVPDIDFLRGDALARLGRNDEAEAAFKEEIRRFPKNTQAYTRLAVVYGIQRKTYGEVDQLLQAMVNADPRPATVELAAQTLETLGDPQGARAWRRKRLQ